MGSPVTLTRQLFDLKQRFVRTMPERITLIAATLAGCLDGSAEDLDRLERQFHALGGTAGTYGLSSVAAAAFEGEEACAELKGSPVGSDGFSYLAFLAGQLNSALASDTSDDPNGVTMPRTTAGQTVAVETAGVSIA